MLVQQCFLWLFETRFPVFPIKNNKYNPFHCLLVHILVGYVSCVVDMSGAYLKM